MGHWRHMLLGRRMVVQSPVVWRATANGSNVPVAASHALVAHAVHRTLASSSRSSGSGGICLVLRVALVMLRVLFGGVVKGGANESVGECVGASGWRPVLMGKREGLGLDNGRARSGYKSGFGGANAYSIIVCLRTILDHRSHGTPNKEMFLKKTPPIILGLLILLF